jgi:hypothetical protein
MHISEYFQTHIRHELGLKASLDPNAANPRRATGPIPHDQPIGPLPFAVVGKFVANLSQIAPIVPVLPTHPTPKCCTVYNLRFYSFHGMEEVIGSIPIRSTN